MKPDETGAELPPGIRALFEDRARVPLVYAHLREAEAPLEVQRVAESRHHRTSVYACLGFYKHVSRCIAPEE